MNKQKGDLTDSFMVRRSDFGLLTELPALRWEEAIIKSSLRTEGMNNTSGGLNHERFKSRETKSIESNAFRWLSKQRKCSHARFSGGCLPHF